MRLFGACGLVDILSDRLYVILFLFLSAFIDALIISPFFLNHEWPATGKSALQLPTLNNYSFTVASNRDH